jgi:hypothetical protein
MEQISGGSNVLPLVDSATSEGSLGSIVTEADELGYGWEQA